MPPPALAERDRRWGERGQSVVYLLDEQQPLAAFALADVIRPRAARRSPGCTSRRAGGDADGRLRGRGRAGWRGELGIDDYFAEVLPERQEREVRELQRSGGQWRWSATA